MKTLNKIQFVFIFSLLISFSCENRNSPAKPAESLTISAAISLKDAFDEIGKAFEATTGTRINFNYGASGVLQKQIETGAPVDVFASAGARQMDELERGGFLIDRTRLRFARNSLVLIVPKNSRLNIRSFNDLTGAKVRKIAIGNPKTVPAGLYAEETLEKMNLKEVLRAKLIPAENVRQVLDYVARGEVDAGIVYTTDARAATSDVTAVAAAAGGGASRFYSLAIIEGSRQIQAAQEFADFVSRARGQEILRKHGFEGAAEK